MSNDSTGAPSNNAVQQANSEQLAQPNTTVADPKLDLYARKERELAKKRQELDTERKKWEAEKSGYIPKSRFKDDTVRALAEVELDYDKLTETILTQPNINDPTIKALHAQIQELRDADAKRAQQAEEAEQTRLEQSRNQRVNEIKLATNGNADFEVIEKWGAHDAVTAYMDEASERGEQISVKDACAKVEEMLVNEVIKVLDANKIKSRLSPAQANATPEQTAAVPAVKDSKWKNQAGYSIADSPRNIKTLTNHLTQESPKASSSEQERKARAIAAMEGRLK